MLNTSIKLAIEKAVADEGQSQELASKILAWMQSLIDDNEDIVSQSSYNPRCILCFDNTIVNNIEDQE